MKKGKQPKIGDYVKVTVSGIEDREVWGTVTDVLNSMFIVRELPNDYPNFVRFDGTWEIVDG